MKLSKVSVALIPAYNEENNIRKVIQRTKKSIENIIVVDDGSKDKTSEIARKEKVIVITHKVNGGKGEAIRTGLDHILKKMPKVEYVVIIDADLQYRPEDSIKLISKLEAEKLDFISGYRDSKQIPLANRLGNWGWRLVFNILFSSNFKDTNCGIIAFDRKVMKVLKSGAFGGYIIDNAIRIDIVKNKFKYGDVLVRVSYGKRDVKKFAKMFFGNLLFIIKEGLKYRIGGKR